MSTIVPQFISAEEAIKRGFKEGCLWCPFEIELAVKEGVPLKVLGGGHVVAMSKRRTERAEQGP